MEFLKQKWSYHFKHLDANRDGVITESEVDETLNKLPSVLGLSDTEGREAIDKLKKWWNIRILKGRKRVTLEEYLNDCEKSYTDDKKSFIATTRLIAEDVASIIHADKTKAISLDNYVKLNKAWGHNNEAVLRKAFELFKPDHGMVPIQEYIDDLVIFLSNDDPSKPDVILDAFKSGLD